VGDCWLLSAMSALAEYDGAITKIFNGCDPKSMPTDGDNKYVVNLFDLATWQRVQVVVDERLCSTPDGSGLLGCLPSKSGELWACYVEKAIAAHCGGWDKISGGQCTHAWRLLLGEKNTYTFKDSDGQGFGCFGTFNPNDNEWEPCANSPHEGFQGLWPMEWPEVGGGGSLDMRLSRNEMFERMCAWDDENYIMSAGTIAGSDSNDTDGIVDGHAYTILDCVNDVAGTEFDLIKVRNPWGKGEFQSGKWDDDGPGWDQYPQVKAALKPLGIDDGIFWLDKNEFFEHFTCVYVCAKDMTGFL